MLPQLAYAIKQEEQAHQRKEVILQFPQQLPCVAENRGINTTLLALFEHFITQFTFLRTVLITRKIEDDIVIVCKRDSDQYTRKCV